MSGGSRRTSKAIASLAFGGMLVAFGLTTPPQAGAAEGPTNGPLTPGLAKLARLAPIPGSGAAEAEAVGVPAEGPGSLVHEGDRVVVEAHFEAGALARLEALRAAGAKILAASRQYQTVALAVDPEDLDALAQVPGLGAVAASRRPVVYGAGETASTAATSPEGICEGGSVISEGLEQLNVPAARAAFGARGKGETIGVISDSFDSATTAVGGGTIASHAGEDEASDDLPGPSNRCSGQQIPVRVLAEAPPPAAGEESLTDEGRAMLQVVHDLAPHAELAFATAYSTEIEFARNIERLAEPVAAGGAGADVIVDDIGYFGEPFYQDGPVADAIRKVSDEGVVYLTAAGNNNLIESGTGNEIASWERAEFHDTACPTIVAPETGEAASNCMDFSPTTTPDPTFRITVGAHSTLILDLQWAEPWYGVDRDLDAYLLNANGTGILARQQTNNGDGAGALPEPVEVLGWTNTGSSSANVQLVIDRCIRNCNPASSVGAEPRLKFVLLEDGAGVSKTEYPVSNSAAGITVGPTVYGHSGAAAAITLGAVYFEEPAAAPLEPEEYSSRGPVTHYFGPVAGTAPAAPLGTPERLDKPNLTATDCASTTFFASHRTDGWHFCGTSEAAPHAAAVAALMRQTDPGAEPGEIVAAMEGSATPFTGVSARSAVGAGLLNAAAALEALGGSPVVDPPSTASGEGEAPPEGPPGPEEAPTVEVPAEPVQPIPPPTIEPAPTVTITRGPRSPGDDSRPTFEFTASGAASIACQMDGGPAQPCASPYVPAAVLADGPHSFLVTATNAQGRSGSSAPYEFTVDTKAPRAKIVAHPPALVRTRRQSVVVRFRLRADEPRVTFLCRLDRRAERVCPRGFRERFHPGRHVLRVRAEDAAGNFSAKAAVFRFRVEPVGRRHRAHH
jgi:hypothetical protein